MLTCLSFCASFVIARSPDRPLYSLWLQGKHEFELLLKSNLVRVIRYTPLSLEYLST